MSSISDASPRSPPTPRPSPPHAAGAPARPAKSARCSPVARRSRRVCGLILSFTTTTPVTGPAAREEIDMVRMQTRSYDPAHVL